MQNYQRHLTSKSYEHEDFGRLGGEDDGLPLEQIRDANEVDQAAFDTSALAKKPNRKRKTPADDEVSTFFLFNIC